MSYRSELRVSLANTSLEALNQSWILPFKQSRSKNWIEMPGIGSRGKFTNGEQGSCIYATKRHEGFHLLAAVGTENPLNQSDLQNISYHTFLRILKTDSTFSESILRGEQIHGERIDPILINNLKIDLMGALSSELFTKAGKISAFILQAWPGKDKERLTVDSLEVKAPASSSWRDMPIDLFLDSLFNEETQRFLVDNLINPKLLPPNQWRVLLARFRELVQQNPSLRESIGKIFVDKANNTKYSIREVLGPLLGIFTETRQPLIDILPFLKFNPLENSWLHNSFPLWMREEIFPNSLNLIQTEFNRYIYQFHPPAGKLDIPNIGQSKGHNYYQKERKITLQHSSIELSNWFLREFPFALDANTGLTTNSLRMADNPFENEGPDLSRAALGYEKSLIVGNPSTLEEFDSTTRNLTSVISRTLGKQN